MSSFKGQIKELENILVDNFTFYESHTCFFLSHCHSDHMTGIKKIILNGTSDSSHFIYCSPISRLILLNKYKVDCESVIKELTSVQVVQVPGNDVAPSYQITVTPIPAGHCPGSVMFLFEAVNHTILYTGDFRILTDDISKFKPFHSKNQVIQIDKIYLDSTFLNESYWGFPSRSEAVGELVKIVKEWISQSSKHNVLLETSAGFGYEFVFVELARELKCKIHVKDSLLSLFWNVPEVGCFLTKHCSTTKVHGFFSFDKKCLRLDDSVLRVKLSSQWYKSGKDDVKRSSWRRVSDKKIVVCYSTHCSCSELVHFLNYLKPKRVEPCTASVGTTEEETKEYIHGIVASWDVESMKEDWKPIKSIKPDFKLENNYKFHIVFPHREPIEFEDFDELPIKKKIKNFLKDFPSTS